MYAGSGAFTKSEWLTLLDAMRNSNTQSSSDGQKAHDGLMAV
jgi:hypothetical protein